MKKLSAKRLLALCLVLILTVSSLPTVAFADTTASKTARHVHVATAPNSLFSLKVAIYNPSNYTIWVNYTVTKATKAADEAKVGKTYIIGYIGARNTKTVELPKGLDVDIFARIVAPVQPVEIKVTGKSHIWNIW